MRFLHPCDQPQTSVMLESINFRAFFLSGSLSGHSRCKIHLTVDNDIGIPAASSSWQTLSDPPDQSQLRETISFSWLWPSDHSSKYFELLFGLMILESQGPWKLLQVTFLTYVSLQSSLPDLHWALCTLSHCNTCNTRAFAEIFQTNPLLKFKHDWLISLLLVTNVQYLKAKQMWKLT